MLPRRHHAQAWCIHVLYTLVSGRLCVVCILFSLPVSNAFLFVPGGPCDVACMFLGIAGCPVLASEAGCHDAPSPPTMPKRGVIHGVYVGYDGDTTADDRISGCYVLLPSLQCSCCTVSHAVCIVCKALFC
jgi:hypothetical protein